MLGKFVKIFVFVFLAIFISSPLLKAEDANTLADGFYNGLAEIIERNMNNPDNCVVEVENYYQANRATVEKIRQLAEKPMAQAMQEMDKVMEKYESMSEEELEALERQAQQKGSQYKQQKMSPGAARYTEAMKNFTMKYPQQAMKVAGKAMRLVPGMKY